MSALNLAKTYFDYSNQSNMDLIENLFGENATYYSANLGFFISKKEILAMQATFHGQYQSLQWTIDSINEIKPNVVEIAFRFQGVLNDGTEQKRQGSEHILVYNGLIQHIAVGL